MVTDSAAEQRQLTVLFCDLVGATGLARRLGLDAWHKLIKDFHTACGAVVRQLDGHVAQNLGDGILAYFGYPVSYEDSARRAIEAAMRLTATATQLGERHHGIELVVRIGIHTGPVVVDSVGERDEPLALGDTPNLAARVQEAADPGDVLITESTYRLTRGFFECAPVGQRALKGFAEPVVLYRVVRESGASNRLEASAAGGELSPLVGRDAERALLEARWIKAQAGQGSAVLLMGEAGVGKSRHVAELKSTLRPDNHHLLECRCSPQQRWTPLYPFVDLLERRAGLTHDMPAPAKLDLLGRELALAGIEDGQSARLFAWLLGVPLGADLPSLDLQPLQRRQATFDLLIAWVRGLAARFPTLLVLEDLHWADPSTLDLIGKLLAGTSGANQLMVMTARPEFKAPWPTDAGQSTMTLGRLDREAMLQLVANLTGNRSLPASVAEPLLDKADGVPLFLEEMTRAVLESGLLKPSGDGFEPVSHVTDAAIPATLLDSLMARLDRMDSAKRVAQLAAVVGRDFDLQVLDAVAGVPTATLLDDLRRLVDSQLLYRGDDSRPDTYMFKHTLVQEAAYQSMVRTTRQDYHRRIATALTEKFPDIAGTRPELLGHHYAAGGQASEAIGFLQLAGGRAIANAAFAEAINHFNRGLELLPALPEQDRARHELGLQSGVGTAYLTTKGFSAIEVERIYARAAQLCDELRGATPTAVVYGTWAVHFVRSDLETTTRMVANFESQTGEQEQPQAQVGDAGPGDPGPALVAHSCVATWAFWRGQYDLSLRHARLASQLCDTTAPRKQHEQLREKHGLDCPLYGPYYVAWCQLICGEADQADRQFQQALALAEAIADPYVVAVTKAYGGALYHDIGDHERTAELAEPARAASQARGFPFWLAASTVQSGWVMARRGDPSGGVQRMAEGLAVFQAIGAQAAVPYYTSYLIDTCIETGRLDQARNELDRALAMARSNLDCNYLPELLRLQGALLAQGEQHDQAESSFRQALASAQDQGAKLLQLRAAMGFASYLRQRGRGAEGRDLLGGIYQTFTEGLTVPQLQEAQRLLQQL